MTSITQHPIVIWAGVICGFITVVATCVGAFLYLEHIQDVTEALHYEVREGLQDKKALDKDWLDLDRADHNKIMQLEDSILHEIELLGMQYKIDNSLLYQLGLRDGQALCKK